jgi:hypothetical protein
MKFQIIAASLLALSTTALASDVGVSINVGQPGFYGRIDIGDYPQPQVIYRQPVLVERPVRYVETAPIYLRVPPGHAKNWSRHCRAYNACGQRVYFVQDNWYNNQYVPRYRDRHGDHGRYEAHRGDHRWDHRDDRRDDRRNEHGRGDDHGRDHDNGHGNGHGRRD